MSVEKDYVLGTHDEEMARLGLQHAVWRPRATATWRRAGFTAGQTLVDLGCGPGYAALDLAEIVGPRGRILAVDRSRRFLEGLEAASRTRGLDWIETLELDLDLGALPPIAADGLWARWVFAFVRGPRRVLARAAAALRPGATVAIHEYVDYAAWRLSPRSGAFEAFVREVMASWRDEGGEPDIGLDLPRELESLGFEIRCLEPIVEIARPGDHVWQWPRTFLEVGARRLVALGRIDESRCAAILAEVARGEATAGAFMVTPAVLEIVATKR
jgi:SAM-dependent methyltransferase